VSGREQRAAFWSYPIWKYSLVYEFLYADAVRAELQTLLGFFNARQGQFDSFLLNDPDDNAVTRQMFGTGDGATTQFQLLRAYGGFIEPVSFLNATPAVYVASTLKTPGTDYTASSTGLVTFTAPPAIGAPLTWTGSYYWRVRFAADSIEVSKFMATLWEAKRVDLMSVKV
jgi:uncharacterized protein (TIGR02217 family)